MFSDWLRYATHALTKGLFIWSRLTGLARFPRSPYTTKSFEKISECSYDKVRRLGFRDLPWKTEISATGLKFFHMNTPSRLPGWKVFWQNWALLSQQNGQDSIFLPSMYFYFGSMRFVFVSKVTRVDKATIVANGVQRCWANLFLFIELYLIQPD